MCVASVGSCGTAAADGCVPCVAVCLYASLTNQAHSSAVFCLFTCYGSTPRMLPPHCPVRDVLMPPPPVRPQDLHVHPHGVPTCCPPQDCTQQAGASLAGLFQDWSKTAWIRTLPAMFFNGLSTVFVSTVSCCLVAKVVVGSRPGLRSSSAMGSFVGAEA
jgi:hypothetical protein